MATVTLYRIPDADLSDASLDTVLSTRSELTEVPVRDGVPARLFLTKSELKVPEWTAYLASLASGTLDVPASQTAGAVLIIKPDSRRRLLYAATWGNGHFLLEADRLDRDLGLRCVVNLLSGDDPNDAVTPAGRVRAVRSKRVSQNTLITETQASRKAPIDTFPFRADVDQLSQLTGTPIDAATWGPTVAGGVPVHIKRPDDAKDLVVRCRAVERTYKSTAYRAQYGWIDNVTQVRDIDTLMSAYREIAQSPAREGPSRDGLPGARNASPLARWCVPSRPLGGAREVPGSAI
jgi:uncharacterized protein (TIGR04141 family)